MYPCVRWRSAALLRRQPGHGPARPLSRPLLLDQREPARRVPGPVPPPLRTG